MQMFRETVHCNEQLLAPYEGFEQVIFHEHALSLEWRRALDMRELRIMGEMGSARHAVIAFENDWRISAVTMISDQSFGALLHGEARRPTYEVMVVSPFSDETTDPAYHLNQTILRELIEEVRTKSGKAYKRRPVISDESILSYCDAYPADRSGYKPDLHGSFEFREEHWYVPEFMNNRVMIPDANWNQIVWDTARSGGREPNMNLPYKIINEWCQKNCTDDFAWTGAAVTWTFRDANDALMFKLRWG
jgi:hypothetical protein